MSEKRSRLTKITTRTGDAGDTKLATGRSVHKASSVVVAMGTIDELNSHIGVLNSHLQTAHLDQTRQIQQQLFDMGAVFAMEGQFDPPDPAGLESMTDAHNATLPPLTEFVLPGGGEAASLAHVCRAVCRRAESSVWGYLAELDQPPEALTTCAQYLNRLSDYFFVLARVLTQTEEEQWHGPNG